MKRAHLAYIVVLSVVAGIVVTINASQKNLMATLRDLVGPELKSKYFLECPSGRQRGEFGAELYCIATVNGKTVRDGATVKWKNGELHRMYGYVKGELISEIHFLKDNRKNVYIYKNGKKKLIHSLPKVE